MYWISEQFSPIPLLQTEYKSAQIHVVNLNVFMCIYVINIYIYIYIYI
jgi:hypothetical protein